MKTLLVFSLLLTFAFNPTFAEDTTVVTQLKEQAKGGDGNAAWQLGKTYEIGAGVRVDFVEADHWYSLAASLGHPKAAGQRKAIKAKVALASEAARLATEATKGNADAAYQLGKKYETGAGVASNILDADHWYAIAEKNGHRKAAVQRKAIAYRVAQVIRENAPIAPPPVSRKTKPAIVADDVVSSSPYVVVSGVMDDYRKWSKPQIVESHVPASEKEAFENSILKLCPAIEVDWIDDGTEPKAVFFQVRGIFRSIVISPVTQGTIFETKGKTYSARFYAGATVRYPPNEKRPALPEYGAPFGHVALGRPCDIIAILFPNNRIGVLEMHLPETKK
jgi:hypothetical protein